MFYSIQAYFKFILIFLNVSSTCLFSLFLLYAVPVPLYVLCKALVVVVARCYTKKSALPVSENKSQYIIYIT